MAVELESKGMQDAYAGRRVVSGWMPIAALGELDKARDAVDRMRALDPKTSIAHHRARLPYQDPAQFARLLDGLRLAGLPE